MTQLNFTTQWVYARCLAALSMEMDIRCIVSGTRFGLYTYLCFPNSRYTCPPVSMCGFISWGMLRRYLAYHSPDWIKCNSATKVSISFPFRMWEWANSTYLTAVSKFKPRLPAQWSVGTHRKGPSRMEKKVTSTLKWSIRNSTQIRNWI